MAFFEALDTLIVDHNVVRCAKSFPFSPNLDVLWLNFNEVVDLDTFLVDLSAAFPRLRYLSLLGNPCVPSFAVGANFYDYIMYR